MREAPPRRRCSGTPVTARPRRRWSLRSATSPWTSHGTGTGRFSAALKPIYTAANADAAQVEFDAFADSVWGKRYPHAVATWQAAWERFIPFLAFPPELRRVIYTTNSIESLNYQLRKIIKNRGQFPNNEAVTKLLWLSICNIEDKRARQREKERGRPADERKAPGRLVEGQIVTNWKQALGLRLT